MQVLTLVVQRVSINVMDYFAGLCAHDLAVFPLPARALCSIAQAFGRMQSFMRSVCLGDSGVSGRGYDKRCGVWGGHFVAASLVFAGRHAVHLFLVGVQRVAVAVPHLVVPNAHFSRSDRAVAVDASAPNDLSGPSVLGGAVAFHPLVVHEAETMRSVLALAAFNDAVHQRILSTALGNSWAVNCARWIGRRISLVEQIHAARKDAA